MPLAWALQCLPAKPSRDIGGRLASPQPAQTPAVAAGTVHVWLQPTLTPDYKMLGIILVCGGALASCNHLLA